MKNILKTKGVTKWFGGLRALYNIDLNVHKNEILGLIGPNGAGKTTLLNCISGFYKPSKGKIFFNGRDITKLPPHKVCQLGATKTFQLVKAFKSITVLDNVLTGALLRSRDLKEAKIISREMIDFVGLTGKENMIAGKLTPADQKALELARALATKPILLMLDEIAAGLNPREIEDVVEKIREVNKKGISLIIVEHIMQAIMPISHRIIVLHHGEKIAEGSPNEISKNEKVIEAYLGEEYARS